MNSTNGQLYITALKSLERLEIQFLPKELDFKRGVNYGEVSIVGRNNPLYHYTGGTNEFTLELDFLAETENREDVIKRCKWLEALTANDGFNKPPEQVRITFGKLFKENEIWIIKNFSYKLSQFKSLYGYLPIQANASVTFALDTATNRKHTDIKWN